MPFPEVITIGVCDMGMQHSLLDRTSASLAAPDVVFHVEPGSTAEPTRDLVYQPCQHYFPFFLIGYCFLGSSVLSFTHAGISQ